MVDFGFILVVEMVSEFHVVHLEGLKRVLWNIASGLSEWNLVYWVQIKPYVSGAREDTMESTAKRVESYSVLRACTLFVCTACKCCLEVYPLSEKMQSVWREREFF